DFIGGYTGARGFTDAGTYTGSGFGIRGQAIGTAGTRYGVYGTASGGTANYAVYAAGDLAYSGNLIGPPGDAIFKENVRPLTAALSKVMQLNGKSFQYSQNEKYAHMNLPTGEHYGLIVQEVEQVFPELVTENTHPSAAETRGEKKDDPPVQYKGLKYMELIPILIEAVKEQQQEIEALKAEISALKSSK
ncbi:MAG: hypothetical protein GWN00_38800, partial [Aliifodinibius sp.]|nr:tail fiber domain-containing protein [Fodinibius sp.]NIV16550.1 hypothetical protein [Fodinibius sp.]NIY30518.1 hypothetical protein [Fodinibius sp.]